VKECAPRGLRFLGKVGLKLLPKNAAAGARRVLVVAKFVGEYFRVWGADLNPRRRDLAGIAPLYHLLRTIEARARCTSAFSVRSHHLDPGWDVPQNGPEAVYERWCTSPVPLLEDAQERLRRLNPPRRYA